MCDNFTRSALKIFNLIALYGPLTEKAAYDRLGWEVLDLQLGAGNSLANFLKAHQFAGDFTLTPEGGYRITPKGELLRQELDQLVEAAAAATAS